MISGAREASDRGQCSSPIDLAINKLVALANRREPRDLVDAIYADEHILPFPALVWAVVDKTPGLNPASHLAAKLDRVPGALLQDRRTGAFFLPESVDDWPYTREHRGALGGVITQPAEGP